MSRENEIKLCLGFTKNHINYMLLESKFNQIEIQNQILHNNPEVSGNFRFAPNII